MLQAGWVDMKGQRFAGLFFCSLGSRSNNLGERRKGDNFVHVKTGRNPFKLSAQTSRL